MHDAIFVGAGGGAAMRSWTRTDRLTQNPVNVYGIGHLFWVCACVLSTVCKLAYITGNLQYNIYVIYMERQSTWRRHVAERARPVGLGWFVMLCNKIVI